MNGKVDWALAYKYPTDADQFARRRTRRDYVRKQRCRGGVAVFVGRIVDRIVSRSQWSGIERQSGLTAVHRASRGLGLLTTGAFTLAAGIDG